MNTPVPQPEAPLLVEQSPPLTWLALWKKNWRTSHWLITSAITTMISFELYNLVLSVYPNVFIDFFIHLGITSLWIHSCIIYPAVIAFGVLSGWLFYSAHLTLISLKLAQHKFQPLLNLWLGYNQDYKKIFNLLLSNNNFLKLSEFLKNQPLPEPIKEFLCNQNNTKNIQKIYTVLSKIWSIQNMDAKIKHLTMSILQDCASSPDYLQHLDNISKLYDLLLTTTHIDASTIVHALEQHSKFNPYIETLRSLDHNQDLLSTLIELPELIPFYTALQSIFHNNPEKITQNVRTLYPYLHIAPQAEHDGYFDALADEHLSIRPATYRWLKNNFQDQPQHFVTLWDHIHSHPHFQWLEPILIRLAQHDRYQAIYSNFEACQQILLIFNNTTLLQHPEYPRLAEYFSKIHHETLHDFCELLRLLNTAKALTTQNLEQIIQQQQFELARQLLLSHPKISATSLYQQLTTPAPMPVIKPQLSKRQRWFLCCANLDAIPPGTPVTPQPQ